MQHHTEQLIFRLTQQKTPSKSCDDAIELAPFFATIISENSVQNTLAQGISSTFSHATHFKFTLSLFEQQQGFHDVADNYPQLLNLFNTMIAAMETHAVWIDLSQDVALDTVYGAFKRVLMAHSHMILQMALSGQNALKADIGLLNCIFHPFEAYYAAAMFGYNPVVIRSSTQSLLNHLTQLLQTLAKPLVIVLTNPEYTHAELRKQVLSDCLELIHTTQYAYMLDVILLTKENTEKSILELTPANIALGEDFTPLAEDAGYYLSHPGIQSAIYRYHQARRNQEHAAHDTRLNNIPQTLRGYVIKDKATTALRHTKTYTPIELKSGLTLTLNHQMNLELAHHEAHDLQEEVSINQQVAGTQHLNTNTQENKRVSWLFDSLWDYDKFKAQLISYARDKLVRSRCDTLLETSHHRQNNLWQRILKENDAFSASNIADIIFSKTKHGCLTGREIVSIHPTVGELIIEQIDTHLDGLDFKKSDFSYCRENVWLETGFATVYGALASFAGYQAVSHAPFAPMGSAMLGLAACASASFSVLLGSSNLRTQVGLPSKLLDRTPFYLTALSVEFYQMQADQFAFPRSVFQSTFNHLPFTSESLLHPEDLASLPYDAQQILVESADRVLSVFSNEPSTTFNEDYMQLIRFHCPHKPKEAAILNEFLLRFFHNNHAPNVASAIRIDECKILLGVILQDYRQGLYKFLNLILFLHDRALLDHFHKIYFTYAQDIFSIANFNRPRELIVSSLMTRDGLTKSSPDTPNRLASHLFLEMALETPRVASKKDWPSFQTFVHHFIVFAACHCMPIHHLSLSDLRLFWDRLYAKIHTYTKQDDDETMHLIRTLLDNLITESGFSLAPLRCAKTFFSGFEQLIDNAIRHHALKEQLRALAGLSLRYTDVLYAISHKGFQVANAHMKLTLPLLRSSKLYKLEQRDLSYLCAKLVSQDCKLETLHTDSERSLADLKMDIFRYLGRDSRREDLYFYEQMLTYISQPLLQQDDGKISFYAQYDLLTLAYFRLLVLAHYVLQHTRENYKKGFDKKAFDEGFFELVLDNPYHGEVGKIPDNDSKTFKTTVKLKYQDLIHHYLASCSEYLAKANQHPDKYGVRTLQTLGVLSRASLMQTTDPDFFNRLMQEEWVRRHAGLSKQRHVLTWVLFKKIYPQLTGALLHRDYAKIETFINESNAFLHLEHATKAYVVLKDLITKAPSIDVALFLFRFVNEVRTIAFLKSLNTHSPDLLTKGSALVEKVHAVWLESPHDPDIERLFCLAEKVMVYEPQDAAMIFDILLEHAYVTQRMDLFEQCLALPKEMLRQLGSLIHVHQLPLPFIGALLPYQIDLHALNEALCTIAPNKKPPLLILLNQLIVQPMPDVLKVLTNLGQLAASQLQQLALFTHIYHLSVEELNHLLSADDLSLALSLREKQLFSAHLERFKVDKSLVIHKISAIRQKSWQEAQDDLPLSHEAQRTLLQDYETVMDYMQKTPVIDDLAIYQLGIQDVQHIVQNIKSKLVNDAISAPIRHGYRLMLLALCCEVIYRTTGHFPRDTQILCVLNTLRRTEHMIHEVQTGEGKSMIMAMLCVVESIDKPVDFSTENRQLIQDHLRAFGFLYDYLGIVRGSEIIQANSPKEAYVSNGINAATPAEFSFFRTFRAFRKEPLPNNAVLLCDEIHVALISSIQYRLAAILNSIYFDLEAWRVIYAELLRFVKEETLYLNNACDEQDDVHNFIHYLHVRDKPKKVLDLVKKVPIKILSTLLDSARVPEILEEGVDYLPIIQQRASYAAPILSVGTKRPQPEISYGQFVQWILHYYLNVDPSLKHPYKIYPHADTIMTISPKNFFDHYIQNGGRIVGLTGTAGGLVDRGEFYQQFGLIAYAYPTFYIHRIQDLGLLAAPGVAALQEALVNFILSHKRKAPTQPILILADCPKAMSILAARLKQCWRVREYNGYETRFDNEQSIVDAAGCADQITVTTPSLGLGTNITPIEDETLLVINCATNITEDELRQFRGRTGRNGKSGQFISIIDQDALTSPDIEDIHMRYQTHLRQVACMQQQKRLQSRYWEISHYFLIQRLFTLKAEAERLLSPQYGRMYALIGETQFYQVIHDFSEQSEDIYATRHNTDYLSGVIQAYQTILNDWFSDVQLERIKTTEPLVELQHLELLRDNQTLLVSDLTALSGVLSLLWTSLGHQQMQSYIVIADQWSKELEPFFKKEQPLLNSCMNLLSAHHLLDDLDRYFDIIKNNLAACTDFLSEIPYSNWFFKAEEINTFVLDYLASMKSALQEKRWQDLALPTIQGTMLERWTVNYNRLMTVLSYSGKLGRYGAFLGLGPAQIVAQLIVFPVIKKCLTSVIGTVCRQSESDYLQIMGSLNDLMSGVGWLFDILYNKTYENMTIGDFLDKFEPYLDNKGILLLLAKLTGDKGSFPQHIQSVKAVLHGLRGERDQPLASAFNPSTLVELLIQFIKSDQIQSLFPQVDLVLLQEKISHLPPNLGRGLATLALPCAITDDTNPNHVGSREQVEGRILNGQQTVEAHRVYGLIKCLAHPRMFECLSRLPQESTSTALLRLIDEKQHPAVIELNDFQTNHDRIAAHQLEVYKQLRTTYAITDQELHQEITARTNMAPSDTFSADMVPTFWSQQAYWLEPIQNISLGFAGLMVFNALFLTVTMQAALLTFAVVLACELAFMAYNHYKHPSAPRVTEQRLTFFSPPPAALSNIEVLPNQIDSSISNA